MLDSAYYEWWQAYEKWFAVFRWGFRLAPGACLPVWLVLLTIVNAASFLSGPGGVIAGTLAGAVVAVGGPVLLLRLLLRSDLTPRFGIVLTLRQLYLLCTATLGVELAVAIAYDRKYFPASGLSAWLVFGLVAMPAVFTSMMVCAMTVSSLAWRREVGITRRHCQLVLLVLVFSVLQGIQSPSRRRDLAKRREYAKLLERAAKLVMNDLLSSSFLKDIGAGDWLRQRAAGWAEAFRHMQRQIVAPVPDGLGKLESMLKHQARCLATGELGALAWRQPGPPRPRRIPVYQMIVMVLRTLLVAALPLAAVLTAQPALRLSAAQFRWAAIATGIWALLYIIISLDPAIREKIETARSLTSMYQQVRSGDSTENDRTAASHTLK